MVHYLVLPLRKTNGPFLECDVNPSGSDLPFRRSREKISEEMEKTSTSARALEKGGYHFHSPLASLVLPSAKNEGYRFLAHLFANVR